MEAIRKFFTGRVSRHEYVVGGLLLAIPWIAINLLTGQFPDESPMQIVLFLLILPLFFLNLSLSVRRFHDINSPGWHSIGLIVPLLNLILGLTLLFKVGTPGTNSYGVPVKSKRPLVKTILAQTN